MIPILADATPPAGTSEWIGVFFFVLGGAYLIIKIVSHFTRRPPIEAEFVTKVEFQRHVDHVEKKIDELRRESGANHEAIQISGEQRKEEIFGRINEIHDDLNKRLSAVGMEMANSIGELRGELRRVK